MAQQSYVSPKRYNLGGFGVDTSSFTAAQLRQILVRASAQADAWCSRSLHPQRADMRGGTITGEQHSWQVQDPLLVLPGGRRVYLRSGPIRTVTAFALQFTDTWMVTLEPSNLFINSSEGYIEIVATQPTILGYPPIGLWFGLSEPVLTVDYTYGWQFEVTGDPCEADSPLLYYASHGNWLPGGTVTVSVAGVEIDPGDYTVNTDDGSITFATAAEPDPDDEVLADYTYVLPQQFADGVSTIATDLIGSSAVARRGMIGLSSLRVAEVSMSMMPGGAGAYVTKNGVTIPAQAAALLSPFANGRFG